MTIRSLFTLKRTWRVGRARKNQSREENGWKRSKSVSQTQDESRALAYATRVHSYHSPQSPGEGANSRAYHAQILGDCANSCPKGTPITPFTPSPPRLRVARRKSHLLMRDSCNGKTFLLINFLHFKTLLFIFVEHTLLLTIVLAILRAFRSPLRG